MPASAERSSSPRGPTGQRRYLTLLFADLCDSTALATDLEAEHYAELLADAAAARISASLRPAACSTG